MTAFGTADIVFRYAYEFKLEHFVGEIGKTVLQQYCTGQPADCKGCGFYEHCPECFQGIPCDWNLSEEGEANETEEGNTD